MPLQAHNSWGHLPLLGSGIHLHGSQAIQNLSPLSHSARMMSGYCIGLKSAIKHFPSAWLMSRRRSIKAQHVTRGSLWSLQDYFQAHIKSMSSALISEYDSGHPWILFLSVMKVSPGIRLRDSFPQGSRRGWGFWPMLCLEKGVDYRNVDVDLSIYTYIEKIYGLILH